MLTNYYLLLPFQVFKNVQIDCNNLTNLQMNLYLTNKFLNFFQHPGDLAVGVQALYRDRPVQPRQPHKVIFLNNINILYTFFFYFTFSIKINSDQRVLH